MKVLSRLMMIAILALTLGLFGCGDDGDTGPMGPEGPPGTEGTIIGQWENSGHGDTTAEAFNHWNEDGAVEAACAQCHSKEGFLDYADDGVVDEAAPIGSVVSCAACHSSTVYGSTTSGAGLEPVTFPSGAEVTLNGPSNICMACHQGRASTVTVNDAIDDDDFGFINIHYFSAAASFFGSEVQGGYEYAGKTYVGQFTHVPGKDNCVDCHMGPNQINHTFEPQTDYCVDCHSEVAEPSDPENPFRDIRRSNPLDYDGDGNTTEGLYFEINDTLVPALLSTMQDYADNNLATAIAYDAANYPYFFVDTNGDGVADADEANFGNQYRDFDATLLKAAFNYQVTQKEPGGYVHNALYIMQIVYDSIEDLGGDVSAFTRPPETGQTGIGGEWASSGHGDVNAEAWNHWNEDIPAEVSTSCAKCHSAEGFRDFAADNMVDAAVPVSTTPDMDNTLTCEGCHQAESPVAAAMNTATLYNNLDNEGLDPIDFPAVEFAADFGFTTADFQKTFQNNSNMCMACHQGRESGLSVKNAIAAEDFGFINRHYFAAAAILFGTEVQAGYEYDGRTYMGQNTFPSHGAGLKDCTGCHLRGEELTHKFKPLIEDCNTCHTNVTTSFDQLGQPFGNANTDYDGDGTGESFQGEIDGMLAILYAQIQDYAANTLSAPIIYSAGDYPYWFNDTNSNGLVDEGEASFPNAYGDFDAALLPAAYNYHAGQDPCGDIHNYQYVLQTLYDSTDALDNGKLDDSLTATRPGDDTGDGNGGTTLPTTVIYDGGSQDPVAFSHTIHADALACSDCHTASPPEQIVVDGFSAHDLCVDCHETMSPPAPNPTDCTTCHGTAAI